MLRVTDDRYLRELRRINLAQRLIGYEVRTATIQQWTGLSDERIRNLISLHDARVRAGRRHRGPAPRNVIEFLRQTQLRSEASVMSALAYLYGVLPTPRRGPTPALLPGVDAGERLCRAFAIYRRVIPGSRLNLEHIMSLLVALAANSEARLAHCAHCHGALLINPSNLQRDICPWCEARETQAAPEVVLEAEAREPGESDLSSGCTPAEPDGAQRRLF
jgi:hypothetical protein